MDEGVTSDRPGEPPGGDDATMSMEAAAARVGVDEQTVRRWFDAAASAGEAVGEREVDDQGRPVPGAHRRPYRRCVEAWRLRRKGLGVAVPVSPAGPAA